MPLCVMTGGGGHAKVLLDCLLAARTAFDIAVVDRNPELHGALLPGGVRIRGGDAAIPALIAEGATHFIVGVGGATAPGLRRRLFETMLAHGLEPLTVIAPSAVCSAHARIGPGCQILPLAAVNAAAILGRNVIVNTGAIVEHDCLVGDHAHIASRGVLLGGARLGDDGMVGAGAVVRQLIEVGSGATLGAGAVAVRDVPQGETWAGVPATQLKPRGERESG